MAASSTTFLRWLLIKVIEDVKTEAPIEAPVASIETTVGAGGRIATAQVEVKARRSFQHSFCTVVTNDGDRRCLV